MAADLFYTQAVWVTMIWFDDAHTMVHFDDVLTIPHSNSKR